LPAFGRVLASEPLELGRWADIRMAQRYSNVNDRIKREAIQRMAKNSPAILPAAAEVKQQSYQTESAVKSCGETA